MTGRSVRLVAPVHLLAFALARSGSLVAEESRLLEFDCVNAFKGYTTTVSVDTNRLVTLVVLRKNMDGRKQVRTVKLNSEQLAKVQTLLDEIYSDSLMPVYGLGPRATDEPTYRFRLPHNGKWIKTRIDP